MDGCHRKETQRSKVCRIISVQWSSVRKPEKSFDRLEPHRNPADAVAGYRSAEHAPERVEEVDLRGRVDGHRAMGQLVQSGFIDLAALEERQLLYHIQCYSRVQSLEYLVGVAVAGAAQQ